MRTPRNSSQIQTRPDAEMAGSPLPTWLATVLLIVITLLVYSPVFKAGYIWDDDTALTENPAVRSLSGLWTIWFTTKQFDYFPLTFTSFWLEWRLWGANPVGYHTVNVLLHALAAILFWRVLLRLKIPGAWLAAMVFALHPVCVASVAWVAERKNTLSMVFYFLSILWFLRYEFDREQGGAVRAKWYWLSLFAFLLALFAKTSVVTLPFVLWLCLWWRRSRTESGGVGVHWFTDFRKLAPYFALALVLGLVTVWFQSHRAMSGNVYQRDALFVRLVAGTWAVWFYLWKALLPLKLSMIYSRWTIPLGSWITYLPAALLVVTAAICFRFRRTWSGPLAFGLGCFFVSLLPVLGFFDMSFYVYSRVADHLQYLAIPSVVALAVGLVCSKLKGHSSYAVIGLVIILLGLLSWNRARAFNGQETIWRDTLSKNPQAWAGWNNLGMATKNPAEEFNCYTTALRLNPNYADAHNNLGVILYQRGELPEATSHFEEAVRLQPGGATPWNNLGGALMNLGKLDQAHAYVQRALQINPNYVDAHRNMGNVLLQLGRTNEAVGHFETVLRLQPRQAEAYMILGLLAAKSGKQQDAIAHYRAALELHPEYFEVHHNLGILLAEMGRWDEALAEFNQVLALKPGFAPAQYQIAEILFKQGRRADALNWYTAVVAGQPNSPEAHHRLGLVLVESKKVAEGISHLREAVKLARTANKEELATQIEEQLRRYEAEKR